MRGGPTQGRERDGEAITLGLLNAVHRDSAVTQRRVAQELDIALGLANAYLKRCVRKGLIKVRQIPANRYAYYLTPKGFAEKTRLTAEYLSSSFTFFREAREQCAAAMKRCSEAGWRRVALAGVSDLAEIATLGLRDNDATLVAIIDPLHPSSSFAGLPVVAHLDRIEGGVDAIIVTDLKTPQQTYEALAAIFPAERLIVPRLLGVAKHGRRPRPALKGKRAA